MNTQAFGKKILRDVKKSYLKSMIMVSLAVLFVIIWKPLIFPDKSKKPVASDSNIDSADGADENLRLTSNDIDGSIPDWVSIYPMADPLPYENIKRNPFEPLTLSEPVNRKKDISTVKMKTGKDLAEEETSNLNLIKLTCTVTGGESYAVVEGCILRIRDKYKGFTLREIGEGFVVFSGMAVTKKIEVEY